MCSILLYVACKTQKHVQKTAQTSDSTALRVTRVQENVVQTDTSKVYFLNQLLNISRTSELSIDKIMITENEVPKAATTTLRFNIDSLHAHGDTLSTTTRDGTRINIYADHHTGELVTNIKPPGGAVKKYEIENIKLKSNEQIINNNALQAAQNGASVTTLRDSAAADSIHIYAAQQTFDKTVERKPTFMARIGWLAVAIGAAIALSAAIKYWSKIKIFFTWIKKNFGV